jgi:hypothetical protein
MEDLKSRMIEKLTEANKALTGTALAKAVGFTKNSNTTKAAIDSLLSAGRIKKVQDERGYDAYQVIVVRPAAQAAPVSASTEGQDPDQPIRPDFAIPVNTRGYKVEKVTGRFTYRVTPPNGGKAIELTKTERLLVINDDVNYRYVVDDAESILQAIAEFTNEVGYSTFIVKDMATGSAIANQKDITNDSVILFLGISRHNKAGK